MNYSYDVITDRDLENINTSDLSNYKIMILHVHPEYWSINQLKNLNILHRNNLNIMYLGANGIYWKTTWNSDQMEVRKDFKNHLDGTAGGYIKNLKLIDISNGEDILKVYYNYNYAEVNTNIINNSYRVVSPLNKLFYNLDLSNGSFGVKNLNGLLVNSGTAKWEVDGVFQQEYEKYIIATTKDGFCDMIWKGIENDGKGKVFSASTITYTGSLLVDNNIALLTTNVINDMLLNIVKIYKPTIINTSSNFVAYTDKQSYYANETVNIYSHVKADIDFPSTINF